MRIHVTGECPTAKALRGYLRKHDFHVTGHHPDWVVHIEEPEGATKPVLAAWLGAVDRAEASAALEEGGIAERKVHLDRPVAVEYRLSPKGLDLFEAIRDLERWAARWVMTSGPREVTQ